MWIYRRQFSDNSGVGQIIALHASATAKFSVFKFLSSQLHFFPEMFSSNAGLSPFLIQHEIVWRSSLEKWSKWPKLTTPCIRLARQCMTSRPGRQPLFSYGVNWSVDSGKRNGIQVENEVSTESVRVPADTVKQRTDSYWTRSDKKGVSTFR